MVRVNVTVETLFSARGTLHLHVGFRIEYDTALLPLLEAGGAHGVKTPVTGRGKMGTIVLGGKGFVAFGAVRDLYTFRWLLLLLLHVVVVVAVVVVGRHGSDEYYTKQIIRRYSIKKRRLLSFIALCAFRSTKCNSSSYYYHPSTALVLQ